MTLRDNLSIALSAVSHVQKLMVVGAQNKITDVFSSFGMSLICVAAGRAAGDIAVPKEPGDGNLVMPLIIRSTAAKAAELGCGNCGEQAAIAFEFLKSKSVRPMDYMVFKEPGDHAFVVIGRTGESPADDYKSWGPEAVVCDPWDGKAFVASDVPLKMLKQGRYGFESWYRLG